MSVIIDGTNGLTFNNATTQASAGKVLQVVAVNYSTQADSTSTSYADTGLTASITPLFSTSKILIIVNHSENLKSNTNSNNDLGLNICRNGSQIVEFNNQLGMQFATGFLLFSASYTYLDSPATTSATTYKTQFKNSDSATDKVRVQSSSKPSTITLMEIAP
jgi:hypothetical protein